MVNVEITAYKGSTPPPPPPPPSTIKVSFIFTYQKETQIEGNSNIITECINVNSYSYKIGSQTYTGNGNSSTIDLDKNTNYTMSELKLNGDTVSLDEGECQTNSSTKGTYTFSTDTTNMTIRIVGFKCFNVVNPKVKVCIAWFWNSGVSLNGNGSYNFDGTNRSINNGEWIEVNKGTHTISTPNINNCGVRNFNIGQQNGSGGCNQGNGVSSATFEATTDGQIIKCYCIIPMPSTPPKIDVYRHGTHTGDEIEVFIDFINQTGGCEISSNDISVYFYHSYWVEQLWKESRPPTVVRATTTLDCANGCYALVVDWIQCGQFIKHIYCYDWTNECQYDQDNCGHNDNHCAPCGSYGPGFSKGDCAGECDNGGGACRMGCYVCRENPTSFPYPINENSLPNPLLANFKPKNLEDYDSKDLIVYHDENNNVIPKEYITVNEDGVTIINSPENINVETNFNQSSNNVPESVKPLKLMMSTQTKNFNVENHVKVEDINTIINDIDCPDWDKIRDNVIFIIKDSSELDIGGDGRNILTITINYIKSEEFGLLALIISELLKVDMLNLTQIGGNLLACGACQSAIKNYKDNGL